MRDLGTAALTTVTYVRSSTAKSSASTPETLEHLPTPASNGTGRSLPVLLLFDGARMSRLVNGP